ncbi:MAG: pyridoxamine 5'-phosphate oxidase [Edaphobacter sp.]|uniref:pyridoxamine 5'-phosphate oxidase n=1 Tax=Edaphobacter sp. TaxID=1934404 RepID=UPI0023A1880F|nr:pyridoxamine 5'-phosphate oxidase [Edaphobacter sp.]MDE1175217.1 pyridoxamine 5'-phosphate oxidase [Edaphobacter sp.]
MINSIDFAEIEAASDPLVVFEQWMRDATRSELNDPNAAALATADQDGAPSVRMVLIKEVDERGFCFFTNAESRKGLQLAVNPRGALCFHWKSLTRQVRVEGAVVELPPADADAYFHTRSRVSQLGAAVSRQSRPLESRKELEDSVAQYGAEHPDVVPRPQWWRGYALQPERIEFWLAGDDRLHDRIVFTRSGTEWARQRLFP